MTYTIEQLEKMLTKTSKGAWFINPQNKHGFDVITIHRAIARVLHDAAQGSGDNEVDKNAVLIAAAPDLAQQLIEALRKVELLEKSLRTKQNTIDRLSNEQDDIAKNLGLPDGWDARSDFPVSDAARDAKIKIEMLQARIDDVMAVEDLEAMDDYDHYVCNMAYDRGATDMYDTFRKVLLGEDE